MSDNQTTPEKRRKRKVSHVFILLLLIGVGAFILYRLRLKSMLQSRIAVISAAGYPITGAELNDWYTIPQDAENAADIILDAFDYYYVVLSGAELESIPVVGNVALPANGEPLSEETMNLIAQYLADNQKTLELSHKAAAIEHCRFPVDYSTDLNYQLNFYSDIRDGIRLLNLEAVFSSEKNNPQQAARSIISSFGFAHSIAQEPQSGHILQVAFLSLTLTNLERVVNRVDFTQEQLAELGLALANCFYSSALSQSLAAQRCIYISKFDELLSPETFSSNTPVPIVELYLFFYKNSGLADMDKIVYLDMMDKYIEAAQLAVHERIKVIEPIEAKLRAKSKIHIFLHMVPSWRSLFSIESRAFAQLRAAQAALAVQRYRLAEGELPETLNDLVPAYLEAVPTDPFDGKEMRYRKLEPGFVVYSVGEDLSDDGGTEIPNDSTGRSNSKWDITFTVER